MRSRFLTILAASFVLVIGAAACQTAPAPDGGAAGDEPTDATAPEDTASEDEGAAAEVAEGDPHGPGAGIAWHEGDMDSAFALAADIGKPIFLYWGAEWCPPCYYLKTKVFVKPEFIAKSQDFVNVYLDGDSERAQILGEEFGVAGYPTVIVFDPAGQEIMRLPNDLPVERFTEVLDSARAMMRPVADILADVREGGAANASPEDLQLLAYYSWSQDELVDLPDEERYGLFKTLYEETPDTQNATKSRFFTEFMNAAIDRDDEYEAAAEEASAEDSQPIEPEVVFTEEEAATYSGEVARILQDSDLRDTNYSFVVYWSRETVELLHPEPSPERAHLIALWDATAQAIENDESQTLDDRMTALYPRLELARIAVDEAKAAMEAEVAAAGGGEGAAVEGEVAAEEGAEGEETAVEGEATAAGTATEGTEGEESAAGDEAVEETVEGPGLPAELVAHVRERVTWARQQPMADGETQTVISTLAWLLGEIDANEEATDLMAEAMDDTHAPYYYMSWIGSLKKEAGEPDEAIEWYRLAYDKSTGHYTRFRWGASYLQTLMELAPEDAGRIESDSFEILGELLENEDAFSLGNLLRLGQYEDALVEWNETAEGAHQGVIDRVRDLVHASCPSFATPAELEMSAAEEPDAGAVEGTEGEGTDAGAAEGGEPEADAEAEGDAAVEAEADDETEEEVETQFMRCLDFLAVEEEEVPTG